LEELNLFLEDENHKHLSGYQEFMSAAREKKLKEEIEIEKLKSLVVETENRELEKEKRKLEAAAEQERVKAAIADARERETAEKLHFQAQETMAAKLELVEKRNKASKLQQEVTALKENEKARINGIEKEIIFLRQQVNLI